MMTETVNCSQADLDRLQKMTAKFNEANPTKQITVGQVAAVVLHKGIEMVTNKSS